MKGMLGFIKITADHLVEQLGRFGEGKEEVDCKVGKTQESGNLDLMVELFRNCLDL